MDRLTDADELLDGPLDDPDALAGNLRDLRRFNRMFGGVDLSRRAIAALAGDTEDMTLLDVGTGGADIPIALIAEARRHGRWLKVTAVDARPEVLAAARIARPLVAVVPGLMMSVSDGRSLTYPDRTFEVAHASLLVHHLSRTDAVGLLQEMARVARRGIVVNDLARGMRPWVGAWLAGHVLTRNRYTRHDAPLSVRRAYSPAEMRELLAEAGLRPVAEMYGFAGHRYAMAAVPVARATPPDQA